MADNDPNTEPAADGEQPPASKLARLRAWTSGNRLRSAIIGGVMLLLGIGTVVTWVTLASLAAAPHFANLQETLESLDAGERDLARLRANRLQAHPEHLDPGEHGGPIYVLGVLLAREADKEPLPERAHEQYRKAALFLAESRKLGVPDDRDVDSLYQLGRTLTESGQFAAGIIALDEALDLDPQHAGQIHQLLGEAHFYDVKPDSDEVLDHLDQALATDELDERHRTTAHLRRALTLGRLQRFDEGIAELAKVADRLDPAERWYAEAQLRVGAIAAQVNKTKVAALRSSPTVDAATTALNEAQRADRLSTHVTAGARYLRGQLRELQGITDEAINLYTEVRRSSITSPERVAASLAEADLLRALERYDEALDAYRRTAAAVENRKKYRSDLLPLAEVHSRFLAAKSAFTAKGHFQAALNLVDHLAGLFEYSQRLELRADVLQAWGVRMIEQAKQDRRAGNDLLRLGYQRLREAGMSYERLAKLRYSSENYSDDLWNAAETYFNGHSFSKAVEVLLEYLTNEPRRRNALALQRLGQSYLALGRPAEAISVFEECIEFYPRDAATYQSRLDGARAYLHLEQNDRAEKLLKANLVGATLTPRSPEWRDSLFELGSLLHAEERWLEAINELEQAVARYEGDSRAKHDVKLAKYLIAESYRHAAEKPLSDFDTANSINERENARQLLERYLDEAMRHYDDVQRAITLHGDNSDADRAMLRNCYMLRGSALFDLQRYEEAVRVFSSVSTLYQNEPFVLETMVQIANCWRRIGDAPKARGAIAQAIQVLKRLPPDTDFLATTSHTRAKWDGLLADMSQW